LANPDVVLAIPALVESGALPPEQAPRLLRMARGELVSVRAELRALLYAGVLVATGGIGLLIQQNLQRIGPVAIAAGLGLAAAAALAWVFRVAPPFSWQEVPSPNLALDYVLLLGILLAAADLAYSETAFGLLGVHRSLHLLIVAGLAGLAACRFDSRLVFGLALTSFAAWRGISLALAQGSAVSRFPWNGALRANAIACGLLFAALGFGLARSGRKAHFEPVAVDLGWLLALGGLASGMFESGGAGAPWAASGALWAGVLLLTGGGLAAFAYRTRRFPRFGYGVVAAYAGLTRLLFEGMHDEAPGCLWLGASSIALVAGLIAAHRRMREAA
jgi:hypothetical protein